MIIRKFVHPLLALLLVLSACGGKKAAEADPMAPIEQGWRQQTIHVPDGGQKPTVLQLLKAFNDTWHVTAADTIFAAVADKTACFGEDINDTSTVFVDCEDYCCAWYDRFDLSSQQLCARCYDRVNGHMLFALRLVQPEPMYRNFCCFYDYNPATQTLTPEDEPYKDLKPRWQDSQFYYSFSYGYDQTIFVEEHAADGKGCFHHFVWDGMKHVFHHTSDGASDEEEGDEPWSLTPDGVEERLQEYFDALNELSTGGTHDPANLSRRFYSTYWNEVYEAVSEKDGKAESAEHCFFVDENFWAAGLLAPVAMKDVQVEFVSEENAEATLTLVETESGLEKKVILDLCAERGNWLINNWLKKKRDPEGSLLAEMEEYIGL